MYDAFTKAISSCFSLTPYYNFGSEQDAIVVGMFNNNDNNGSAWAGIIDGGNHFNIISAYVNENLPQDTTVSLQGFRCYSCSFYPISGNSSGLWIYGSGQAMVDGYIVSMATGPGITFYNSLTNGPATSAFQCRCNIEGNITSIFSIVSKTAGSTPIIPGLQLVTQATEATSSVFALGANTSSAILADPDIHIEEAVHTGVTLFDTGLNWMANYPRGIHIGGTAYLPPYSNPISGITPAVNSTLGGGTAICSGIGTSGTCTLGTNSTIYSGTIVLTPGGSSINSTGEVNFAMPFKMGDNAVCSANLMSGGGAWASGASVTIAGGQVTPSNTAFNFNNNGTTFSSGITYLIQYNCEALK